MTTTTIFTNLSEKEAIAVLSYRLKNEGIDSADRHDWIDNSTYQPLNQIWQESSLGIHQRKLAIAKNSAVLAIYYDGEKPFYYI